MKHHILIVGNDETGHDEPLIHHLAEVDDSEFNSIYEFDNGIHEIDIINSAGIEYLDDDFVDILNTNPIPSFLLELFMDKNDCGLSTEYWDDNRLSKAAIELTWWCAKHLKVKYIYFPFGCFIYKRTI